MPIHDWSKVRAGVFHDFHQSWTIGLRNALNKGVLPAGYFAMAEQFADGIVPDVVTLERFPVPNGAAGNGEGGVAVAEAPPKALLTFSVETDVYAAKANRIVIREPYGEVVAVIEFVSPGNKSSRHALDSFVDKACNLLDRGIHLLVVDLFPPSERDPQGIHGAIWSQFSDERFELARDKPLTVASYLAGPMKKAYVDPVAVGSELPASPIFLSAERYVRAPLESTYQATWADCPEPMRAVVEGRASR
jgi:hypothetical protein